MSTPAGSDNRERRRIATGLAALLVVALATIAILTGISGGEDDSDETKSTSPLVARADGGYRVKTAAGAVPQGADLKVRTRPVTTAVTDALQVTPLSRELEVTVSSEPTLPSVVTFPAPETVPAGSTLVVVWSSTDPPDTWQMFPVSLDPGSSSVSAKVPHFSGGFLAAVDPRHLRDVAFAKVRSALTGRADVAKPHCGSDSSSSSSGLQVASDGGDSVWWCAGNENGENILKIANNRTLMVQATFPKTWKVIGDQSNSLSVDSLVRAVGTVEAESRSTQARIIDGGDTIELEIPPNGSGRVDVNLSTTAYYLSILVLGADVFATGSDVAERSAATKFEHSPIIQILTGAGESDETSALRSCTVKGAGALTGAPVTSSQVADLGKYAWECVPPVMKVYLRDAGREEAGFVENLVTSALSEVWSAVSLLFGGLRQLYDDIASFAGRSDPDFTIAVTSETQRPQTQSGSVADLIIPGGWNGVSIGQSMAAGAVKTGDTVQTTACGYEQLRNAISDGVLVRGRAGWSAEVQEISVVAPGVRGPSGLSVGIPVAQQSYFAGPGVNQDGIDYWVVPTGDGYWAYMTATGGYITRFGLADGEYVAFSQSDSAAEC